MDRQAFQTPSTAAQLDRYRTAPEIKCFLVRKLAFAIHELKVVPLHQRRHEHMLLQVANVATDAPPCTGREGNEIRLHSFHLPFEPPLWAILRRLWKDIGIPVSNVRRYGDSNIASYPLAEDRCAF